MKEGRIKIIRKRSTITNGRPAVEETEFYACWCQVRDLTAKETYEALQQGMENTIVFDVRTCKKVEEICLDTREFYARYKGREYKIFDAQPFFTGDGKARLKCRGIA